MKAFFLFAALLLSAALYSQSVSTADHLALRSTGGFLDAPVSASGDPYTRTFADYFMRKATLIDAWGTVIIGRDRIVAWRENQMHQYEPAGFQPGKIRNSLLRLLRPDLALVVAQTQANDDTSGSGLAYNILWRRIDGKWYIESCTITPVVPLAVTATAEQP